MSSKPTMIFQEFRVTPDDLPGLKFRTPDARWIVARAHAEDPRQGWAVWEGRPGQYRRRLERVHLGTRFEAEAVAEVLDRGFLRHVLRLAELGHALAVAAVVSWARRWGGTIVPPAPNDETVRRPWADDDNACDPPADDMEDPDDVREVDPAVVWSVLHHPDRLVAPDAVAEFVRWYFRGGAHTPNNISAMHLDLVTSNPAARRLSVEVARAPDESDEALVARVWANAGGPVVVRRRG